MDAADYVNWIAVYNDAYDAIKEVSQNTKVGPVFHYEHLSGNGILNAPENDPENRWVTEYWEAIDLHDLSRVDIVGITLYPWLNHENPEDISSDYLHPLLQRLDNNIPIAITETAWPAENLKEQDMPWTTTPEAQLRYVQQLQQFLPSNRVEFILWPFLYQPVQSPVIPDEVRTLFGGMAFHDGDNLPLPAYPVWRNLQLE